MSFTKEHKVEIINTILRAIKEKKNPYNETLSFYKISRQTVYKYIKELIEKKLIKKVDNKNYTLLFYNLKEENYKNINSVKVYEVVGDAYYNTDFSCTNTPLIKATSIEENYYSIFIREIKNMINLNLTSSSGFTLSAIFLFETVPFSYQSFVTSVKNKKLKIEKRYPSLQILAFDNLQTHLNLIFL